VGILKIVWASGRILVLVINHVGEDKCNKHLKLVHRLMQMEVVKQLMVTPAVNLVIRGCAGIVNQVLGVIGVLVIKHVVVELRLEQEL